MNKMAEKIQVTIGQKLKELRKKLKISTQELSTRTEIGASQINSYELDRVVPTISTLHKLSEGLECTIFDIIDEPLGRNQSRCIHSEICPFYQKELQ
jgi:transcriptional regulator with XRE-family HTH domain